MNKEIIWNIVNSILGGALVFFGILIGSNFEPDFKSFLIALATSVIIVLTKFKEYWDGEQPEYKIMGAFKFI